MKARKKNQRDRIKDKFEILSLITFRSQYMEQQCEEQFTHYDKSPEEEEEQKWDFDQYYYYDEWTKSKLEP